MKPPTRTDAALLPGVGFHRCAGEEGSARHARRAAEAAERMAEVEACAAGLGVLDLSKPGWVRLHKPGVELLWRPALACLTGRVGLAEDGRPQTGTTRLPSVHCLDVDGWREQATAVMRDGQLDLSRAKPYVCPVVVWRERDLTMVRCDQPLRLDRDQARKLYFGERAEVWRELLRVYYQGATGVSPLRLFPITAEAQR